MSKISEILTVISETIAKSPKYKDTPIYWDESELNPNTGHFPCIVFKVRAWQSTMDCGYERILEIRILTKTENKRYAILELWEFEEELVRILDEAMIDFDFELNKVGGSELAILTYNKKDKESYKSTGTVFGSAVIDYYNLRY